MSKGGLTIFNFILLAVFSFSMFNAFTLSGGGERNGIKNGSSVP